MDGQSLLITHIDGLIVMGFYEVEFHLNTEIGDIYINTETGDRELEDEWSSNNPQIVELSDCYLSGKAWDWYYFLENLYETYERK